MIWEVVIIITMLLILIRKNSKMKPILRRKIRIQYFKLNSKLISILKSTNGSGVLAITISTV